MGVERLSPSKNRIWLIATPKTAQMASLNRSLFSTFSFGRKKCRMPKTARVIRTLMKMIALGIR
jgi:hypothetical protein